MIIIIGHYAGNSGAVKVLLSFLHWIKHNTSYKVYILLRNGGELMPLFEKMGNVDVWERSLPAKRKFLAKIFNYKKFNQRRIINKIKRQQPILIFSNTVTNGAIIEQLQPHVSCPILTHVHEMSYAMQVLDQQGDVQKTLQYSHHFIAVSESVKQVLMQKNVAPEKISLIYGSIAPPAIKTTKQQAREKLQIPTDATVIGACGTVEWRKGSDLFVQVARKVIQHNPQKNIWFVWIGGGSKVAMLEMQHDATNMQINHRVVLTGSVSNAHEYYPALDIFLMTSREDPFPLVNIEAAMHQLPIVGFKQSGGTSEFVDDTCGFMVEYIDVVAMSEKVNYLLQTPELIAQMGKNAQQKAQNYTTDIGMSKLWGVLQQQLNTKKEQYLLSNK